MGNPAFTRTCVVTREKHDSSELLRIVKTTVNGKVSVKADPVHNLPGRGCYIKKDLNLLELALKKGILSRALKLGRKVDESEVEELKTALMALSSNG